MPNQQPPLTKPITIIIIIIIIIIIVIMISTHFAGAELLAARSAAASMTAPRAVAGRYGTTRR